MRGSPSGDDVSRASPGPRIDPWLAAILALCLTVRVVHVLSLRDHPLFDHPVVDAGAYLGSARSVLAGRSFSIWQAPLYVYFLAGLLRTVDSLLFVRLVQALLSTCSCWIVHALARRRVSDPVARIASLGFALYGPLVYFDGELLATALFVLLGLAAVLVLCRAGRCQSAPSYLLGGLVLGLAALARGTILPLVFFLLAWIALEGRGRRPGRPVAALLLLAGLALPLALNAAHNLRVLGEPILVSPATGINLYVGNNPDAEATQRLRPGAEWNVLAWAAQREDYERTGPRSRRDESAWFVGQALDFAARDPLAALAGLGRKLVRTLSGEEIPRNLDLYDLRETSPVLRALLWPGPPWIPFGLVLPLALCGVWMRRRLWREDLPLLGHALSMLAVCVVFFPTARFRVPAAPVALIYAAFAVHAWWTAARAGRMRAALPSLAAAFALSVLCNAGWMRLEIPTTGELAFFTGDRDLARGDLAGAEERFREAVAQRPGYPDPHYGLALVHVRRGRLVAARADLQQALGLLPRFAEAHTLLGDLERDAGQDAQAAAAYRSALEVKPTDARVRAELARCLLSLGRPQQALDELALLLRDRPRNASGHALAGECREALGDTARAAAAYAQALAIDPSQASAHRGLGRLLLERGELERARQHLAAALALDPTDTEARALLERL